MIFSPLYIAAPRFSIRVFRVRRQIRNALNRFPFHLCLKTKPRRHWNNAHSNIKRGKFHLRDLNLAIPQRHIRASNQLRFEFPTSLTMNVTFFVSTPNTASTPAMSANSARRTASHINFGRSTFGSGMYSLYHFSARHATKFSLIVVCAETHDDAHTTFLSTLACSM